MEIIDGNINKLLQKENEKIFKKKRQEKHNNRSWDGVTVIGNSNHRIYKDFYTCIQNIDNFYLIFVRQMTV